VTTEGAGFLRARRPEQKRLRYQAILDAARALAERDGIGGVSLAGIAAGVGMHKSALLKYFGTREEIFLRLAEVEWREWVDALAAALPAAGGDPDLVASTLGRSFGDRPLFCQLLLHAPLTLERNVSIDVVRAFKLAIGEAVEEAADALHRALPGFGRAASFELLAMTGIVASGMWQAANPPPVVLVLQKEIADADRDTLLLPDFETAVTRFARIYLAGLAAS
jgi:AcrR family transcriptional regulator